MNATTEPTVLDVSGLPPAVVRDLQRLVSTLRGAAPRTPIGGRLEPQKLPTPTLEEFQAARRELWAGVPQDLPEPTEGVK